uniref:Peptidase_M24 domain-containing protein n=1 Tax=Glossina austeni TaxID=7395 RepID=A0A1A9UKB5_GLOAU
MSIDIKSSYDIFKIQQSCTIAAKVLEKISKYVQPGISTEELNLICHQYITSNQNTFPAALGYCGFPKSVCISINDVVCHGIPDKTTILKLGDILNIDVAVVKDGYYGDTSKMFCIGAYIDEGSTIDTWSTIGSCAQIGKNVHISGGAGIGGVLEPMQSRPTIIEDNCFIGARAEIVEGVIVEANSYLTFYL